MIIDRQTALKKHILRKCVILVKKNDDAFYSDDSARNEKNKRCLCDFFINNNINKFLGKNSFLILYLISVIKTEYVSNKYLR